MIGVPRMLCFSTGVTRSIVKDNISFENDRHLLGVSPEQQQRLLKAILDQQWPGIQEYGEVLWLHHTIVDHQNSHYSCLITLKKEWLRFNLGSLA